MTPAPPTHTPREVDELHTRLLKCALEVEEARAYWSMRQHVAEVSVAQAFDAFWFGSRSMARVEVLLANMRARFDAIPAALRTLSRWPHMTSDTRLVICHWHLQFADPLYRRFTGELLVQRRQEGRGEITRDVVTRWVARQGGDRWGAATQTQFASKLLSAAYSANLVASNRDPRPLRSPRLTDEAATYGIYLMREIAFEGSLLDNPYWASIGLEPADLEERLRALPALAFQRAGGVVDYGWHYTCLDAWADATLTP